MRERSTHLLKRLHTSLHCWLYAKVVSSNLSITTPELCHLFGQDEDDRHVAHRGGLKYPPAPPCFLLWSLYGNIINGSENNEFNSEIFLVDKTFWWGCTLPSFQKWCYVPWWMSFMENKLGLFQNLRGEFQFCIILLLWTWMHCISTSWKLFWREALLFLITLKQKILMTMWRSFNAGYVFFLRCSLPSY